MSATANPGARGKIARLLRLASTKRPSRGQRELAESSAREGRLLLAMPVRRNGRGRTVWPDGLPAVRQMPRGSLGPPCLAAPPPATGRLPASRKSLSMSAGEANSSKRPTAVVGMRPSGESQVSHVAAFLVARELPFGKCLAECGFRRLLRRAVVCVLFSCRQEIQ